jgi:hypothetical protein
MNLDAAYGIGPAHDSTRVRSRCSRCVDSDASTLPPSPPNAKSPKVGSPDGWLKAPRRPPLTPFDPPRIPAGGLCTSERKETGRAKNQVQICEADRSAQRDELVALLYGPRTQLPNVDCPTTQVLPRSEDPRSTPAMSTVPMSPPRATLISRRPPA